MEKGKYNILNFKLYYIIQGIIMSKDVENLRKHERVLNHIDIIKNKLSSNTYNRIKVGLLEFHPYDCCAVIT